MAALHQVLDLLARPLAAPLQAAEVALLLAGLVALTLGRHSRRR